MNKLLKLFLSFLGVGLVSAASVEYLPSDIPANKVATAYNASKQVKGKYRLENAKMVREAKANPKDRLEVEIGDDGENFKPKVKVKRWDEVDFSLELLDGEKGNTKLETEDDKIKWRKGNKTARFYEIAPNEEYPEGAFEFDIELAKKPKTNIIEFSLNTKGVDFFYQPALTQAEIDDGAVRPENVVGSYAVYASEQKTNWKGGKEYKVGKVGHIYRPKIYDASGAECWGSLNVDKEAGKLSVEIPQEFLDKAVYPVVVDPTFGYTTAGGTGYTTAKTLYTFPFSASESGILTSLSASVAEFDPGDKMHLIIYDDSNRIDYTAEETSDSSTGTKYWLTKDVVAGGSISSGTYYLGFYQNVSMWNFYYDDGSPTHNAYQNLVSYSSPPPSTWTITTSTQYRKFSIYATYEAGGGETSRRIIITQ